MGVGIIPKYSKYRVLVFVFPHVRHIQVFLTPPSIHLSISPNPSMDDWWIRKYESYGFQFSKELTDMIRGVAQQEINSGTAPNGAKLNGAFLFVAALLSNWILRHEQTYSHPVSFFRHSPTRLANHESFYQSHGRCTAATCAFVL